MAAKTETGMQRCLRERREAIELLKKCYVAGHRDGWQDGQSNEEVMNELHAWMCNNVGDRWANDLPELERPHLNPLDRIAERVCGNIADNRQVVIRLEEGWGDVQVENPRTEEVLNVRHEGESFDAFIDRVVPIQNRS